MKSTKELFEKYASEGEGMDNMEALNLLTKAYIKECGISLGMRTLVYTAGEMWLYGRLFQSPDCPFTKEQKSLPFKQLMPLLCSEYDPEYHDQWDIWGFDYNFFKRNCYMAIRKQMYDEPTLRALCWGIKNMPVLYEKWEELFDEE